MTMPLNSRTHGLIDPTRMVTAALLAASAILHFVVAGRAFLMFKKFGESPLIFLLVAMLGVSLGVIASLVRYRRPIGSSFLILTAAPFLWAGILLIIGPAFAGGPGFAGAIGYFMIEIFVVFCISSAAFGVCAAAGCAGGHAFQWWCQLRRHGEIADTTDSLTNHSTCAYLVLAAGILGCSAALLGVFMRA